MKAKNLKFNIVIISYLIWKIMELTPAMKQYQEMKRQNPDCVLFFRIGDFYEVFFEDADICHNVLNLVLTSKNKSAENLFLWLEFLIIVWINIFQNLSKNDTKSQSQSRLQIQNHESSFNVKLLKLSRLEPISRNEQKTLTICYP